MYKILTVLVVGGAWLTYFGVQEYRVSAGTTAEPVLVDLAESETTVSVKKPIGFDSESSVSNPDDCFFRQRHLSPSILADSV